MNIEKIDNIVYNHTFDIENIKRAYFLMYVSQPSVNRLEISTQDKRRLNAYIKDFKSICKLIIKQENILNYKTCKTYMNTLTLIITKMRIILHSYKIDLQVESLIKQYTYVNRFIPTFKSIPSKYFFACVCLLIIIISIPVIASNILNLRDIELVTVITLLYLALLAVASLFYYKIKYKLTQIKLLKLRGKNTYIINERFNEFFNKAISLLNSTR